MENRNIVKNFSMSSDKINMQRTPKVINIEDIVHEQIKDVEILQKRTERLLQGTSIDKRQTAKE